MKVEGLMIGDWVCLEDENLPIEERYFKIEYLAISVGASWVNQGTNAPIGLGDGESLIPVFKDEVSPIPITTEILEKNGFYDTSFEANRKYKYAIHTSEYQVCYYTKTNSFNVYKRGIDPFYTKDIFCCGFQNIVKYVHELQHALKLCGINKEIVL